MNYKFEKIVGTTFHNVTLQSLGMEVESNSKVPEKTFKGWVWPEPDNKTDRFAKHIDIRIPDQNGLEMVQTVGYLKQNSPLYRRLKVNKYKPLECYVHVKGLSVKGLNDEYTMAYDADGPRFK